MKDMFVDVSKTVQRKIGLDKYFNLDVLAGDKFICPFYKKCRESHKGNFFEGQLHHVGNHYDISISGNPFRVMVVGQVYGHGPSCVSMEQRSQMVVEQTGLQKVFSNRNPHMRGTTSVLRLLFGIPLGGDRKGEFLQTTDNDIFHLFDAFALVNYLLCSAIGEDESRRGKSTPVMRTNCNSHFKQALEILEPTIVIVQGKSYWKDIQRAFSDLKQHNGTLYESSLHNRKIMIGVFTHPSTPDNKHNWGRDATTLYLLQQVVPTVGLIRQELIGNSVIKGEIKMPSTIKPQTHLSSKLSPQPYDAVFEQIIAGLIQRYSPEVANRYPRYDHSTPNRLRIYLDRIKGTHYEICFRQNYYEFALHFESSPSISLERRKVFDPHINQISSQVGERIKSGPLENKGWMRVWYERQREQIDQEKINLYIDRFSRFIAATFPILVNMFD